MNRRLFPLFATAALALPAHAAELTYQSRTLVSTNNAAFNLSVFPGKAGYDDSGNPGGPTLAGVFGDGTVTDYRFYNSSGDELFSYADGGAGLVAIATSDHGSGYGTLGAYRSGKGGAPPSFATVDGALASGLDSPFPHLGFAMERTGPQVVYPELFAAGPGKPLPCYADPLTAYRDLFGSVVSERQLRAAVQVDKNILDFMASDIARFQKSLPRQEKEKLDHYLDGFEALQVRSKRLAAMEEELKAAAPDLTGKYNSSIETERLDAHFELAASALVGRLTQVVAIRADHLGMRLTGLGLGTKTVHHIGHMIEGQSGGGGGQDFESGMGEFATRELIMDYHMKNIAAMADSLHQVPEGDGTMLDNTLIVYLSDHGEKHHSNCYEWPIVALGNIGGAFKAGHYIHVPGWGEAGHRTIGHLYTSLLHGAGLPQDRFGQPDHSLPESIDQSGPLVEWMG